MSRIDHQSTYSRLRLSMYTQGRTIRKGRERGSGLPGYPFGQPFWTPNTATNDHSVSVLSHGTRIRFSSFHSIPSANGQVHHPCPFGQHSLWVLHLLPTTRDNHIGWGSLAQSQQLIPPDTKCAWVDAMMAKAVTKVLKATAKQAQIGSKASTKKWPGVISQWWPGKTQQNVWSWNHITKCKALLGCVKFCDVLPNGSVNCTHNHT